MSRIDKPDSSAMTDWTSPIVPGTPHPTGVAQRRPWPVGHFKTRVVRPILPFLTTLYLRAQLIHQLARNVHVFHMQSIYIARQALHLVILLNDSVDANEGPSDEQDDERNDLEDELIELSKAMNEWGSDKGDDFEYERQAAEIEQQYAQVFKGRFYFRDVRACSTDSLYQRFVAYDAKTIRYRPRRETPASMLLNSPTTTPKIHMISSSSSTIPGTPPASSHSMTGYAPASSLPSVPTLEDLIEERKARDLNGKMAIWGKHRSAWQVKWNGWLMLTGIVVLFLIILEMTATEGPEELVREVFKDVAADPKRPTEKPNRVIENTINHRDGVNTLEQLMHSGGTTVLSPPMPPLTPDYVERREATRFLEEGLFDQNGATKPGSKILVVTGLAGCGKTQLALKFVEKHGNKFATTSFIDGSSEGTFQRDIVRHVRSLGTAHSQKTFDGSMKLLSQPLPAGERIMIIDSVDDPTIDLAPFLPRWPNGIVIITSRDRSRGQLGSSHLELGFMSQGEAVELLVRGSGRVWPPSESDERAAVAVANELGYLPIALVQAFNYMKTTGYSAATYINRLRNLRERLLNDPATNEVDIRYKTAFAAFDASFEILPLSAQKAVHLLSFFHAQTSVLELLNLAAEDGISTNNCNFKPRGEESKRGRECLGSTFCPPGHRDPLELDSIVKSLRNHSLIALVSTEGGTLVRMHPLLHEWARFRLPRDKLESLREAAIRLLCCGASESRYFMFQYLRPRVQALSSAWDGLQVNDTLSFALILQQSRLYSEAAKLQEAGYEQLRSQLGDDHLYTIKASANLADIYCELGRYGIAKELKKEVLRQRRAKLGVYHPDTILASASLAVTYRELGQYGDAEELQKGVLQQRTAQLGVYHLDTICASADLAETYRELGRFVDAEELQKGVLQRRMALLGVDHPDTIRASAYLATIYHELGRYSEAEEMEKEVLQTRRKLLGADHPDTVTTFANLAVTYRELGRYGEAEELWKKVLRQRTANLGERHPDTLRGMYNLAQTYEAMQRRPEAIRLASKAAQMLSEILGVRHPLYLKISNFLESLTEDPPLRPRRGNRALACLGDFSLRLFTNLLRRQT